jgi:hypothetical protein
MRRRASQDRAFESRERLHSGNEIEKTGCDLGMVIHLTATFVAAQEVSGDEAPKGFGKDPQRVFNRCVLSLLAGQSDPIAPGACGPTVAHGEHTVNDPPGDFAGPGRLRHGFSDSSKGGRPVNFRPDLKAIELPPRGSIRLLAATVLCTDGVDSTVDGSGSPAGAGELFGLAVKPGGRALYFVDDANNTLNIFR